MRGETAARERLLHAVEALGDQVPAGLVAQAAAAREGRVSALTAGMPKAVKSGAEWAGHDPALLRELGSAYGYYEVLDSFLLGGLREYFAHELDVVETARSSCPPNEAAQLGAAVDEVRAKAAHINRLLDNDLPGLQRLLSNPSNLRAFLSFSFYTRNPA